MPSKSPPTPASSEPPTPAETPATAAAASAKDERPDSPPKPVKARYTGPEPVFNPEQGIINPGDTMLVSPEQLADPGAPFEPVG